MLKFRIVLLIAVFLSIFSASCKKTENVNKGNKIEGEEKVLSVDRQGRTVVERFGRLRVEGAKLLAEDGAQIQLRGMSSHGLQWHGKYANETVMRWLRDDFNMQVWRSAMYLGEGGYIVQKSLKFKVEESVEAAVNLGLYVIIDWHVHLDRTPVLYKAQAVEFFVEMAQKYGSYPNIIYEICNEPNGPDVTWDDVIKPYAQEIISEIRKYDPDNIIIVGTPDWSRDVDIAALNPIQSRNIMYTLHFYAGSHGVSLRNKVKFAVDRGLPVFVTECGTTRSSGGGGVYEAEFLEWLSFLNEHQISWVNWSVNNKGEDSGILIMNADREGRGGWTENELSDSGKFIRKIMRNEIKIY